VKFRKSSEAAKDMTLVEHLAELRARIVKSLLAVVVFAISITVFYNPVLRFLTRPYRDVCSNNAEFECDGSLYGLGGASSCPRFTRVKSAMQDGS
jgi:Sec-independent protein secretion pathway component TatC